MSEDRGHLIAGRFTRRGLAKVAMGVGGVSAAAGFLTPVAGWTNVTSREFSGPLFADGTPLVDADGNPLTVDALEFGSRTTVFPEGHPDAANGPTLLVRYQEEEYAAPTELAFTVQGYAAYSKVCTHAGCMVTEYENGDFVCPCHLSKFDPRKGAEVLGGPAPRPLPQLPITLSSDGHLIATGTFEGPIGPGGG